MTVCSIRYEDILTFSLMTFLSSTISVIFSSNLKPSPPASLYSFLTTTERISYGAGYSIGTYNTYIRIPSIGAYTTYIYTV